MERARIRLIPLLSCFLFALPAVRSQPCDTVSLPNGTVIEADDLQYEDKCIVVPNGSTVTINGLHRFRSVLVENAGRVTHSQGTDRIQWVVEENVVVRGMIDVSGKGLFGANKDNSGRPAEAVDPASTCDHLVIVDGAGALAGGSYGGQGGVRDNEVCLGRDSNAVYGRLDMPCFPGSGGGRCVGGQGGDGGGVVWIEAGSIVVNGQILANGGQATNLPEGGGGGSGGSIYLKAMNVSGNGSLHAKGGDGTYSYGGGGGGGGRIAIEVEAGNSLAERSLNASGGAGWQENPPGQVGTVWVKEGDAAPTVILGYCNGAGQPGLPPLPEIAAIGRLVIRGPVQMTNSTFEELTPKPEVLEVLCAAQLRVTEPLALDETTLFLDRGEVFVGPAGTLTLATFDESVASQGTLWLEGPLAVQSPGMTIPRNVIVEQIGQGVKLMGDGGLLETLTIESGATIRHAPGLGNEVRLQASGRIHIKGLIDVSGRGLFGANRDGNGEPAEAVDPASTCDELFVVAGAGALAGGSYGGQGGVRDNEVCRGGESNATYGGLGLPCFPGSGGGSCVGGQGGDGGGVVWIEAGTIVVDGQVLANGEQATNQPEGAGGGSGGSIYLKARSVTGRGHLRAQGGGGTYSYGGGGGGGGRIAIDVEEGSGLQDYQLDASGGQGWQEDPPGQVGTVWVEVTGRAPTLILGYCNGQGQPGLPPLPEIDTLGRLVISGPIRMTSSAFQELTPKPEVLEVLCAAQLRVTEPLALDETALFLDRGEVLVGPDGLLTLETFDETVAAQGTLRLEGPLAVRTPGMTIPRYVTVEQIGRGVRLLGDGGLLEELTIDRGATITHVQGAGNEVRLEATDRIEVLGGVDVSSKGLSGGNRGGPDEPAEAVGPGSTCGAVAVIAGAEALAGGSHGGQGGVCGSDVCLGGESNFTYGSPEIPCFPGSGGGACVEGQGGNGGGVVWIEAHSIVVGGYVYANGEQAVNTVDGAGGGAGGSIYLRGSNVSGNGSLQAQGGGGTYSYGGGGGSGGRIGIDYIDGMALREGAISVSGGAVWGSCVDAEGAEGAEGTLSVRSAEEPAEGFHRGDPNNDGRSDLVDAVALLNFLFADGPEPSCLEAGDIDDDGTLMITDPISLLYFLFSGGREPAPPGPPGYGPCGTIPPDTIDLGCVEYTHC